MTQKLDSKTPGTYAEAISLGYRVVDRKIQQIYHGNRAVYVSIKADLNAAPIQIAGGKRKGQLFVWHNDGVASGYSVRLYLAK